ncbi:MAG TPA: SDR family oxidoreductase [Candidatus Limnocylindrales bacterium]|nr:SDR family oxidoreductase [Candidatus Limnocylindrales bacterium]
MPTAIVTGASRGLGQAFAEVLRDAGWNVVTDGRSPSDPSGYIRGDITDPAHRAELIAAAPSLDLLINNAGALGPSPLPPVSSLSPAALRELFETNVMAPLALTQLALPLLSRSGGVIINLTSDAAVEAYEGWGGYGASKAALDRLGAVLGVERTDVTVWQVDPGDVRTKMHQDAFPGEDISDRPLPAEVAPALLGLLAKRPPSGRHRLADFR